MKIRPCHIALPDALALTATAVHSQQVMLYGTVDTGVEYLTNVGPESSKLIRVSGVTGAQPSRWGLRGEEDLGGGLKMASLRHSF